MKYCPDCGTEYDEEVIQFCTKDGTPLIEKDEPRFTAMPSENEDVGEDTVVRKRNEPAEDTQTERGERIVIPATPAPAAREQQVRTRPAQAYYAPPAEQPNTGKIVALSILGTVAAIGFGALLFWALTRGGNQNANINVNTNPPNMNVMNTNGFNTNFNFNSNVSLPPVNLNSIPTVNINSNVKASTPTPKPSPSPTASVVPTVTPERTPRPSPSGTPRSAPSPTPTPRTGPRPPGNFNNQ
ncbi:MAG: hypothetical protein ACJ73D_02980 [Pyrinomonadaceae bacterium]